MEYLVKDINNLENNIAKYIFKKYIYNNKENEEIEEIKEIDNVNNTEILENETSDTDLKDVVDEMENDSFDDEEFEEDGEMEKDEFEEDDEMENDSSDDDEMENEEFEEDDEMENDRLDDDEIEKDEFEEDDEMEKDEFEEDDEMEDTLRELENLKIEKQANEYMFNKLFNEFKKQICYSKRSIFMKIQNDEIKKDLEYMTIANEAYEHFKTNNKNGKKVKFPFNDYKRLPDVIRCTYIRKKRHILIRCNNHNMNNDSIVCSKHEESENIYIDKYENIIDNLNTIEP